VSLLFVSAAYYFPGFCARVLPRKRDRSLTIGFLQVPFREDFLSGSVNFLPYFSVPQHYVKEDEMKDDWCITVAMLCSGFVN